jgi:hypothetical protein
MSRKTSETTSQTTGSVSTRRVRVCFMDLLPTINQRAEIRGRGIGTDNFPDPKGGIWEIQ